MRNLNEIWREIKAKPIYFVEADIHPIANDIDKYMFYDNFHSLL